MKDDHDPNRRREEEDGVSSDITSSKRKMEDNILLAKQKAQEIAARLVSNAESKRPRLADTDEAPEPYSNTPFPVPYAAQTGQFMGSQAISRKMSIPNGKVGLIIGKGGETIKYLQSQSGAKIQITKDMEADPHSRLRDVDLMGTEEQISRAEELIGDMISQSEAAGGIQSENQAPNPVQPGGEQLIMKIPNNKVALIIGKGGESIRTMQNNSGARIQIIPLHLPPGDTSLERNIYIDGLPEQIESAKEMINEVINGKRLLNPTSGNSYNQQPYSSAGNWGSQGQPPAQQPHYGYTQPGGYHQPSAPAPYYANYQPYHNPGYGYYAQPTPDGSAPPNPSYGYDQSYSQQPPSYGQPDASSAYGAPQQPSNPDGTSSSEQPPAYTYAGYGQPAGTPNPGYWAYAGQPSAQPYYDQSYYQTAPNEQYQEQQPQETPATNGSAPDVKDSDPQR